MKLSLALGERKTLSRQMAWGCFTTNLALPGFGSLLAGRVSGYPQALLCIVGLLMTMVSGARFIFWYIVNRSALADPQDPVAGLELLWAHVKWPLLSIGLFGVAWVWSTMTSVQILHEAKRAEQRRVPPPLGR
jgi:hypothetical protein